MLDQGRKYVTLIDSRYVTVEWGVAHGGVMAMGMVDSRDLQESPQCPLIQGMVP
jgi:hypothetical protein